MRVMRRLLAVLCLSATIPLAAAASPAAADNPLPPSVSTGATTAIGQTTATLTASVDPNGAATTYRFEYGTSDSYGLLTAETSAGDGDASASVEVPVSGLTSDTTYHFRIVATNAAGVTRGSDRTLKTLAPARAPGVSTSSARDVLQNSATLRGSLDPRGQAATYRFEWGTSSKLGSKTPDANAEGSGSRTVSAPITGLQPYTVYYYRLVANNSTGTSRGSTRSLRTLRAPTGVELSFDRNPALWGGSVVLSGRVLGSGISGTSVR